MQVYRKPRVARWALFALFLLIISLVGYWRWRPHTFHGIYLQSPQPLADFTLATSAGQPMRLSDLRGRYVILYVGYTYCPDVCPLTLADLATTMQLLGDQARQVQVLFITVDPERDTAAQLASYLAHFDPNFLGMTGSKTAIDAAVTQLGIFYEDDPANSVAKLIDHTSNVIVVDRQGRVRLLFPPGSTASDMAADLAYLLQR